MRAVVQGWIAGSIADIPNAERRSVGVRERVPRMGLARETRTEMMGGK
jgi:hypothetical protein